MAIRGTGGKIGVGDRLPKISLPRAGTGTPRPLRGRTREAVVVVALHDPECGDCADYLRSLAAEGEAFALWDGRVRAVADARWADHVLVSLQAALEDAGDVLVDRERVLVDRLGTGDGPSIAVADRYGQVFETRDAGPGHDALTPRELEEWLRYLATQCPE